MLRIKSNNINLPKINDGYFNQSKRKHLLFNSNTQEKIQKNSYGDSFIKNIFEQKKQMNDLIDKVKLNNFKERLELEDDKDKAIKSIKDYCNTYKDQLGFGKGYNNQLDSILSGDVDTVTRTMDYGEVDKHISNLEYAVANNCMDSLAEYYHKGVDKNETLAQYKNEDSGMDINKIMSSDTVSEEAKGKISLLEGLKDCYKNLYDIMDRIKQFQEESAEKLKELQKNMGKNIEDARKQEINIISKPKLSKR